MRGRKSAFTPGRYAAICGEVAKGASVKSACAANGIHRRTLYLWAAGNPRIARSLKDAQAEGRAKPAEGKRNGSQKGR